MESGHDLRADPGEVAHDPPDDKKQAVTVGDPAMLHYGPQTCGRRPAVERRPHHSEEVGNRYDKKKVEMQRLAHPSVQEGMQRPLPAACRTLPARQGMERTLRQPSAVRRIDREVEGRNTQ